MSLPLAELKCYLVVTRAIQSDRNSGKISVRQVSQRARVALRHAHEALAKLAARGLLRPEGKPGAITTYSLPHSWRGSDCIPTGEQLGSSEDVDRIPTGKQLASTPAPNCIPAGEQNRFPPGKQHLEFLEKNTPAARARDSNRENANTRTLRAVAPALAPGRRWPLGGWASAEDFETWFSRVVQEHPNKNRNGTAKTLACELVFSGILERAEFETGYAALRRANEQRWTEEHGRYAPNLHQLLDDRAWKHAPVAPRPVVPSAGEYLQRINAE